MKEDRRPIGYWLKHLDGLIEENFERTLAGEGATRRQWQALNTLYERPSTQAEIAEALKPFLVDDPGADRRVIDELIVRGWVRQGEGDLLELTPAGVRAHAALLERIQATRQLLVRGVTPGGVPGRDRRPPPDGREPGTPRRLRVGTLSARPKDGARTAGQLDRYGSPVMWAYEAVGIPAGQAAAKWRMPADCGTQEADQVTIGASCHATR